MDVEKSNRAPQAFRDSIRAAVYTLLIVTSPCTITVAGFAIFWLGWLVIINGAVRGIAGLLVAAIAIRLFAQRLNRYHTIQPPDPP